MQDVDTLIEARWVVPVRPFGVELDHHAVAIKDGRIEAITPISEARQQFRAQNVVDLPSHALIPGLVNAHTHAAMSLFRGMADDLPLMEWLNEHIWRRKAK